MVAVSVVGGKGGAANVDFALGAGGGAPSVPFP